MFKRALMLFTLMGFASFVGAEPVQLGSLQIDQIWSREMPPVAPTAAAYFVVTNQGQQDDRLLDVQTSAAGRAELHEHVHADGVMKMQHVPSIDIPAGEQVVFMPMGYHVMLFDLPRQHQTGEVFELTLRFAKAGDVVLQVPVQAQAPDTSAARQHH